MITLFSKIKEVTELSAISGHEAPVRSYLREKIAPHVDEVVLFRSYDVPRDLK